MVIDTNDSFFNGTANNSVANRNVIAHEAGHGLGMAHVTPVNFDFLLEPFASFNPTFDGPQYHDILVAHRGYGDVNEKSNSQLGNDTTGLATSLGGLGNGGSISIGLDAQDQPVGINEVDFVSIDDESDTDVYSFTVGANGTTDILLEAFGVTYDIGPEGGATGAFDTSQRSNLALEILDTDGTTVLGSANAGGLGADELLSGITLNSAGGYLFRTCDGCGQFRPNRHRHSILRTDGRLYCFCHS